MYRHQGKNRTLKHNIRIAIILSFVAGIVNVCGYLAFKQFTTNVTGHFALFIYDVANLEFWPGMVYFLCIFAFLLGAFYASFLIEYYKFKQYKSVFVIPTLIESSILLGIGLLSFNTAIQFSNSIIYLLLFSMGMQNSFVTKISNTIVRTTHLTGLFTDLGIELSQLCFSNLRRNQNHLISNIKLRVYIILCFFSGGLVGGFLYSKLNLKLKTLIFAAFILLISIFFDYLKFKYIKYKRIN